MTREKAWLAWSSGKDSAWALHVARHNGEIEIVGLLTTVTDAFARVTMHGVREELVEAQAAAVGLPLHTVRIPTPCPNEAYEEAFARILGAARREGVRCCVFGDLFLADVRQYRETQLARAGMVARFPLWGEESASLAGDMIRNGLRAYVTCIDPRQMPRAFAGAAFDEAMVRAIPAGVDPCGENGEFHTFAWDGPMFRRPVRVRRGRIVEREGFLFQDLLPENRGQSTRFPTSRNPGPRKPEK